MKVLLLENSRRKRTALHEELEEKNIEVVSCTSTNDFLTLLSKSEKFDKIVMNEEFWDKGSSIYRYFGISSEIQDIPLITYNASENFSNLSDRTENGKDKILHKPVDANLIIEAVLQN